MTYSNGSTTTLLHRKLGRGPPKHAPALHLGRYLTGVVPPHPTTVDHFANVTDWGLYGNDQYGDCGPVSVANQRKLITRYLTGTEQSVSQNDVFDLYRRSGNPNFDPTTDADDNGVDMQTMCEALLAGGIGGTKALAFAQVDVHNLDEVRAAMAIFGSVLLGVTLDTAQQTQTDAGLWDYRPSSTWGGHAILAGRYTSSATGADVAVITWAEIVGMTDRFWSHQVEEAWIVIWPEHLGSTAFQQGIDLATLAQDYTALTGGPFPVVTPPAPVPTPVPTPTPTPVSDADRALATAMRTWLAAKGL